MSNVDLETGHVRGGSMADWIRNTIMLTVLAVWAVFVIVTLARGREMDAVVWGTPAAAYFALNPTWKKGKQDGSS